MMLAAISGEIVCSDISLEEYGPTLALDRKANTTITLRLAAPVEPSALREDDIVNAHDIDGRPFLTIARRDQGYRIRAHGYADFDIEANRKEILCQPVPGCPESIMAQLFVDRVLPNTVSRAATPVFHSSVIAHEGRAAMFMGDPGLGKSTLASALCPPGEWVCDDSAVLRVQKDQIDVFPSYPFARLFDDSLSAVGGKEEERASARNHKWRLRRSTATGAQQVAVIFSLAADGSLQLTSKSRRDGVTELARHLYRLDPSDRSSLLDELDALDRIAKAIPIYELQFPRRYDALPSVRTRILETLASS